MVIREGIPAALVVVFAVLWLLWLPVVVVVAFVQKRTIGLAILFGMLLGPFGFYVSPGCRREGPEPPVGTHICTPITIGTDIGTARDGPTTTCRHGDVRQVGRQRQAVPTHRRAGTRTRTAPAVSDGGAARYGVTGRPLEDRDQESLQATLSPPSDPSSITDHSEAKRLFIVSICCCWLVMMDCAIAIAGRFCPCLTSPCDMLIAP